MHPNTLLVLGLAPSALCYWRKLPAQSQPALRSLLCACYHLKRTYEASNQEPPLLYELNRISQLQVWACSSALASEVRGLHGPGFAQFRHNKAPVLAQAVSMPPLTGAVAWDRRHTPMILALPLWGRLVRDLFFVPLGPVLPLLSGHRYPQAARV